MCAGGVRSLKATGFLRGAGFANVSSVIGGCNGWRDAGLPVESGVPARA
jgi:rhodanese-related sulfurtransferase